MQLNAILRKWQSEYKLCKCFSRIKKTEFYGQKLGTAFQKIELSLLHFRPLEGNNS